MTSRALTFVLLAGLVAIPGCGQSAAGRAAAEAAAAAEREKTASAAAARAAAAAALEVDRLAALWSYHEVPAGSGRQLSASIYSAEGVDTSGDGARRVQLVFRDHPSWGRSSYLVLQGGDFDCDLGCTVTVTADDAPGTPMAARRPQTDDAIAMFIDDERALWQLTAGAAPISVEFPVDAGGTRVASFDVAGLDRAKMPGWDGPTG